LVASDAPQALEKKKKRRREGREEGRTVAPMASSALHRSCLHYCEGGKRKERGSVLSRLAPRLFAYFSTRKKGGKKEKKKKKTIKGDAHVELFLCPSKGRRKEERTA